MQKNVCTYTSMSYYSSVASKSPKQVDPATTWHLKISHLNYAKMKMLPGIKNLFRKSGKTFKLPGHWS